MSGKPLQVELFRLLAGMVERRAGLHYGPHDADLAWDKMVTCARDRGFESLLDYYYALRYDDADGAELARLVEALVVHETYLFREWDQLVAVVDGVLAPAVRRGARPRIWSAACATGEEPYGLAMLLDDRGALDAVEIVATDISARVIERARAGRLGPRALRSIPVAMAIERWGCREGDGFQVGPRVREAVGFDTVNLLDAGAVSALGCFDVILCRNVLIYFSDDTIAEVVRRLAAALVPTGSVFVGVSESLLRFEHDLVCEERGGVFSYRRPA